MPACRSSAVCLFLLASAALAIGGAHAQPSSATQPPQQYKFSTRIAPGVATPDSVESRLSTLKFFDGFPDDASVEKLYDSLDFQRAVQAYLLGLPPVNQLANRKGILEVGPANTTVPIFETMMNARSVFLTPNNNTPYTWFWLDLRNGPLVVEVPPNVLGLLDDMWYRFVIDIGMVGPDKGKGGKYLILPPGYRGKIPAVCRAMRGQRMVNLPLVDLWKYIINGGVPALRSTRGDHSVATRTEPTAAGH